MIHGKSSLQHHIQVPSTLRAGELLRIKQTIKLNLAPNKYTFDLSLLTMSPKDFAQMDYLSVTDMRERLIPVLRIKQAGLIEVLPKYDGGIQSTHSGFCDLPGSLQLQVIAHTAHESLGQ